MPLAPELWRPTGRYIGQPQKSNAASRTNRRLLTIDLLSLYHDPLSRQPLTAFRRLQKVDARRDVPYIVLARLECHDMSADSIDQLGRRRFLESKNASRHRGNGQG